MLEPGSYFSLLLLHLGNGDVDISILEFKNDRLAELFSFPLAGIEVA